MKKTKALIDPKKMNLDKLSKKELVKMIQDGLMPINNPEEYKAMIRSAMPGFVKEVENKEDAGTAIYEAGQEMMLAVVDVLKRYFGFTDEKIKEMNRHLTDILKGVEAIEENGLSMLSLHSMNKVGDIIQEKGVGELLKTIAEIRYQKHKTWKSGIEIPNTLQGSSVEKRLIKAGK